MHKALLQEQGKFISEYVCNLAETKTYQCVFVAATVRLLPRGPLGAALTRHPHTWPPGPDAAPFNIPHIFNNNKFDPSGTTKPLSSTRGELPQALRIIPIAELVAWYYSLVNIRAAHPASRA